MANLRETPVWEEGIYQFETSDPVVGGENGIDNVPTRQLANRTLYLRDEMAKNRTHIENELATHRQLLNTLGQNSLPIGAIFAMPKGIALSEAVKLSDRTYDKTQYPDLYKVLNTETLPNINHNQDIGMVSYFPIDNIPVGWLSFNDIATHVDEQHYPDLYHILVRKYGAIDNVPKADDRYLRSSHGNLQVGQTLDDAMRNLTGAFRADDQAALVTNQFSVQKKGIFGAAVVSKEEEGSFYDALSSTTNYQAKGEISFDAARQVPTADEFRPKTLVMKLCIKAKDMIADGIEYWIKAKSMVESNTQELEKAILLNSFGAVANRFQYDENNKILSTLSAPDYSLDRVFLPYSHIRFTMKRNLYWMIVGGNTEQFAVLGLCTASIGNTYMGQIATITGNSLRVDYAGSTQTAWHHNNVLELGDDVEVINTANHITVNVRKQNTNYFVQWFVLEKSVFNKTNFGTTLGFLLGASGIETKNLPDAKVIVQNLRFVSLGKTSLITEVLELSNHLSELNIKYQHLQSQLVQQQSNVPVPQKWAVLVVAGQSNAVGYDESPVNNRFIYREHPRIKQLGLYDENNLKIISLGHCAENYQDMRNLTNPANPNLRGTKGLQLPLAHLLLEHIPDDYGILVISAAFGGTGFTTSAPVGTYDAKAMKPSNGSLKWSMTSPYYLAMKDRIKYVLDLNQDNVLLGVVWIQGEHDVSNATGHWSGFTAMTDDFFAYFNNYGYANRVRKGTFDKDIWFNVESTKYWKNMAGYQTILQNYRTWNSKTYVAIPVNTDTNEVNGTGATSSVRPSHYGNDSYHNVIAPAVLQSMILANTLF